jgi:biopolymer transport protein ExbD
MSRRKHHYRRRSKEPAELNVTTFLNLMVVLVPFLLITAVFSRMTIVELTLPSSTGGAAVTEPTFRVEVIVREDVLEVTNGTALIASVPNVNNEYDLDTLSQYMVELKRGYPDIETASVLLEPHIEYDYLIQVMDVVRSVAVPGEEEEEGIVRVALFPEISIGDAP